MKPLPTYTGMLTDIVLVYGGKICMQKLKVEGVSNSMPFMHYPNKNFLGVHFSPVTLLLVVYLDTLEEFLMLFWKKTILVTCYSRNTKCLFIFVMQFVRKY